VYESRQKGDEWSLFMEECLYIKENSSLNILQKYLISNGVWNDYAQNSGNASDDMFQYWVEENVMMYLQINWMILTL
jgi:hypothetical protein